MSTLDIDAARGLVQRWARGAGCFDVADLDKWERAEELEREDLQALLGWVREEMASEVERRKSRRLDAERAGAGYPANTLWGVDGLEDGDREALAHHIMQAIGCEALGSDPHGEHGLAWTLCELAGWPEVRS